MHFFLEKDVIDDEDIIQQYLEFINILKTYTDKHFKNNELLNIYNLCLKLYILK